MEKSHVAKPIDIPSDPVQWPIKPEKAICGSCGEAYEAASIQVDEKGNVSLHCPECGALLDNEKLLVQKQLRENLQENFQGPITKLNDETRAMWQKTIMFAQYGFLVRMILSVIVFIVGMVLLSVSSWKIIFGTLTKELLFGTGITFVSGLGTMLVIIYQGPLKEIRQSVSDLGIASAAFIAYVHQVLQISHTFSYLYLNQRISFDEMKASNELIRNAMMGTVGVLYPGQSKSIEKPKGNNPSNIDLPSTTP